jgi:hypothetical protein
MAAALCLSLNLADQALAQGRPNPPPPAPQATPPAVAPSPLAGNIPPNSFEAETDFSDPSGQVSTVLLGGRLSTATNSFFQNLGTNGRTCFTCHQPQSGWSVTPADLTKRFNDTAGADPIFRPVDGATCPNADTSTRTAKLTAYSLLLDKGLIRVAETLPNAGLEYRITVASDPYQCTTNPNFGLTSPTTGDVSVYRRILPASNLPFRAAIMWDGRYPTLAAQASDATLDHAQAAKVPTDAQILSIVTFEDAIFSAQFFDATAGALNILGASGGPVALAQVPFHLGINDSLGRDPARTAFNRNVFSLYAAWDRAPLVPGAAEARRNSIGRGETLFNTRTFTISDVPGLTDNAPNNQIRGTCSTCHDTPNVGSRSLPDFLNIGVAAPNPNGLSASDLPVFNLTCTSGVQAGRTISVTDPGRALVTGKCTDIGGFSVPTLRGVGARAPYFHNGIANNLAAVVGFYDRRFRVGLSATDRADLVAFLEAL